MTLAIHREWSEPHLWLANGVAIEAGNGPWSGLRRTQANIRPGTFDGPAVIQYALYENGQVNPRLVRLIEDMSYLTLDGELWTAGAGLICDGATIPRLTWPIVGSPFTGRYRRAVLVHDDYCKSRERSAAATHRVLHEAARQDGTNRLQAWTIYRAVRTFGPSWEMAA